MIFNRNTFYVNTLRILIGDDYGRVTFPYGDFYVEQGQWLMISVPIIAPKEMPRLDMGTIGDAAVALDVDTGYGSSFIPASGVYFNWNEGRCCTVHGIAFMQESDPLLVLYTTIDGVLYTHKFRQSEYGQDNIKCSINSDTDLVEPYQENLYSTVSLNIL